MGLLIECPHCKIRNSLKKTNCSCGFGIKKASHKTYWIEYYYGGKRKRERIGPSKAAAENRHREVLKARTEEKYIDLDQSASTTLGQLIDFYLDLPQVKAKKSYRRDHDYTKHLLRILGPSSIVRNITTGTIDDYQHRRLAEPSPRRRNQNIKPATVNKEVSCLKTIFNCAIRHGRLKENPVVGVKKLKENNVRMHILTQEEFSKLYDYCAPHLKPIVLTAYYTGMRRGEIIKLTWDRVDLNKGFVRLTAGMTKTSDARAVPLHPKVLSMLRQLPRGLYEKRVFLKDGKPFNEIKTGFKGACRRAKLDDFTFHDLRHCALNNMRLAGNDYFRIMAASGHKTTSVFKRYNLVTEDELSQMKWLDEGVIDTNTDTKEKRV